MFKPRVVSPVPTQPRPASIPPSPLLSAFSSNSPSHAALVRRLTWLFTALLVAGLVLYVYYQTQHMSLVASLDRAYSYRQLEARFVPAPLTSQHAQPTHSTPQPATPTLQHAATTTASSTAPYTPTFAILILGDAKAAARYAQHWSSIACYAHRHNYTFLTHSNERPQSSSEPCGAIDNFFFRKHCTVAQTMLARPDIDWWLVLDGDVFVVSAEQSLSRWLSSPMANPRLAGEYVIHHYERFHNGEIMAGNYIVGNTPHAIDYLMGWSDWYGKVPGHSFHNFDNGALHLHLLSYVVGVDSDEYRQVLAMYQAANSWAAYDAFVGAFRCVIGRRRLWPELGLRIVRRGHFAVRDFFVSSEGDRIEPVTNIGVVGGGELMFHGWKESIVGVWWAEAVDEQKCTAERDWTPRLVDAVKVDMAELLRVVRERERYTVTDRRNSVAMQDVSDCFPQCPAELTVAQGEVVRERLCPAALRQKYVKQQAEAAVDAG